MQIAKHLFREVHGELHSGTSDLPRRGRFRRQALQSIFKQHTVHCLPQFGNKHSSVLKCNKTYTSYSRLRSLNPYPLLRFHTIHFIHYHILSSDNYHLLEMETENFCCHNPNKKWQVLEIAVFTVAILPLALSFYFLPSHLQNLTVS